MSVEKFLTPREAAVALSVGMTRVYALLYSGQLEGRKADDGANWLIPASAIQERLKAKRQSR